MGAEAALELLARTGRPGRDAAAGLDLLRSVGLRESRRRRRDGARRDALSGDGRRPGYTALWQTAAAQVGAEVLDLGGGFLELRRDEASTRVWNGWVMLDDIVTLRLAEDKALAHGLLADAGLPSPAHRRFDRDDLLPALEFLAAVGSACVVKPLASAGGSGITAGVRTPAQLRRACLRAGRESRALIVERQAPGDVLRILLYDGEPLDVLRRRPPTVVGDGRSTITELIAAENDRRFAAAAGERPWVLRADLDCVFTLQHAGLSLRSVPPAGERVAVKTAVSQNGPADNESILGETSDELLAAAALAARTLGVRLAGVDVITRDPARSLSDAGGVILEVNARPGLHYHGEVREPERAVPVATLILDRLLETAADRTRSVPA